MRDWILIRIQIFTSLGPFDLKYFNLRFKDCQIMIEMNDMMTNNFDLCILNFYRWMWLTSKTGQKFASLSFLDNSWAKVEGEHRCRVSFFLVKFICLWFAFPDWEWFRFISRKLSWSWLYVKEDRFFSDSVVIFCANDKFTTVGNFHAIDNESVIVSNVSFHVFNTLS